MKIENVLVFFIYPVLIGLIVKLLGDSKIEKLKASLSEKLFSHSLLFEKEFNIYQELWGKLEKLRCSIAQLNSPFEFEEPGKSIEELKEEKLHELTKDLGTVKDSINRSKPFFAPKVYDEVQEIIKIAIGQIGAFHFPSVAQEDIVKRYQQAEKTGNLLLKITGRIEEAIRNRLFSAIS